MVGATAGAKTKPVATMGSEIETYVWSENTAVPTKYWFGIATSADFVKQTAVVAGGNIWDSANSGATWAENTAGISSTESWSGIATSADFVKQTAVVYGGKIWDSANSGVTGVENAESPNAGWVAIATSANFVKQIVAFP